MASSHDFAPTAWRARGAHRRRDIRASFMTSSLIELRGHGLPLRALQQHDLGNQMVILQRGHDTHRCVFESRSILRARCGARSGTI